ncbi:MAG: 30S ribosomal protein S16 [Candidatus Komeilibacteria bacterium]|nr:30S ribosomal protein S16 [Candidatus Komeilibacteria bacterium]
MLTIRFSRIGKRKNPFYRIIISEKQRDTHDRYLELLGHYDPRTKEISLKADRITHWIRMGATLSNSVFNLLVQHKVIQSDTKRKSVAISGRRKAAIAEKDKAPEVPKAEATAEAETEAPAPEAPQS